jgi:release factor glutamine methyltransferase
VFEGDLFAALPDRLRRRVDVVVVNAPYVPTAEIAFMPPEARDHEAIVALDGGTDGLDVHRRVAAEAREWLAPGGLLVIETSERQAERTRTLFRDQGFDADVARDEDRDATAVTARAPR